MHDFAGLVQCSESHALVLQNVPSMAVQTQAGV